MDLSAGRITTGRGCADRPADVSAHCGTDLRIERRADVSAHLVHLGVVLDGERNQAAQPDADITGDGSGARVLVLRAGEEIVIARHAARLAES